MKISAMFYVVITTIVLITLTIMVSMNLPFNWLFYTMLLGQALVAVMVYNVLRDQYTTKKTFEDWYEDLPSDRARTTLNL
jgi:uncharacterized membrane protein